MSFGIGGKFIFVGEQATPGANVNEYRKVESGYGSTVKFKPKAGQPAATAPIGRDYFKH